MFTLALVGKTFEQNFTIIQKHPSILTTPDSHFFPIDLLTGVIPFVAPATFATKLFDVANFNNALLTYTPNTVPQPLGFPIVVSSPESRNLLISVHDPIDQIKSYIFLENAGSFQTIQLAVKISKVNWVMGDMVSLTRQGDASQASNILLDLTTGQIIREPIRADIRGKKCAFFGFGKVVCLT